MKKTLVSALTTALVVGAASTTFAAANPFSDVPADHWAYDAVSQLAADGVIEGYGDSTYRGDRNITRYEMAQMVARAMAKSDVSAADKAMIDKLAAEFADELNSLGVRVANLEKHADMVKWNGKLEYTYTHDTYKFDGDTDHKNKANDLLFRLEPSAEVNDHWTVNARIDGKFDMSEDTLKDNLNLKRAWAQGDYKNFSVRFGRFSMYGNDSINDTEMSGADLKLGNDNKVSGVIGAGRTSGTFDGGAATEDLANRLGMTKRTVTTRLGNIVGANDSVFYVGVDYNAARNKGLFGGLRFFRYAAGDKFTDANGKEKVNNIWQLKAGYQFDKNSALHGYFAKSNVKESNAALLGERLYEGKQDKSWNIQFDYKGAQAANKGTWGAWLGYRYLGYNATPAKTWDVIDEGLKGWAIGANYTFMKNIVGTLQYGDNKLIGGHGTKVKQFFGRVEWFF
ncbi:MAG: S-layer protein [Selenomonas ruminantium]|nr:S-layer protein [Selenomonas ruminantium]